MNTPMASRNDDKRLNNSLKSQRKRGANWGEKQKAEFVRWSAMSSLVRSANGAADTRAEYSRRSGIPYRTLQEWEKTPHIAKAIVRTRVEFDADPLAAAVPAKRAILQEPEPEPDAGTGDLGLNKRVAGQARALVSSDELMPIALDRLAEKVNSGDPRALETLFRLPIAVEFMKTQAAQFNRTFDELTDDELAIEILSACTDAQLLAELAARGLTSG